MGPTAFEREPFVPVCISPIFVCTSKGSKIQRFQNFEIQEGKSVIFEDVEMRPMAKEEVQTDTNGSHFDILKIG